MHGEERFPGINSFARLADIGQSDREINALIGALATTIGKRAFGLSVVRTDGRRVTFKRSFVRATTKVAIFGLFPVWLSLGLIVANISMVAARPDKRAIHDLIAGTAVVRT